MKRFFYSIATMLVAIIMSVIILLTFILGGSYAIGSKRMIRSSSVLVLDLSTHFQDSTGVDPVSLVRKTLNEKRKETLALYHVICALNQAAHDKHIRSLYITGNIDAALSSATVMELREALIKFKVESGKPIIAYNNNWNKSDYLICAGIAKMYINPVGYLDFTGTITKIMFIANALKKYGIEAQMTRVGRYKSAVEPFIRERISKDSYKQSKEYIDEVWLSWKKNISDDRSLTIDKIQYISDNYGFLQSYEAVEFGLIDKVMSYNQVLDELKLLSGYKIFDISFPKVGMNDYIKRSLVNHIGNRNNRIALFIAEGEIVDSDDYNGQMSINGTKMCRELHALSLDPQVKAIVIRVNSPGGSVLASNLIRQEIAWIVKKKPVVVSMGNIAASGGYMISVGANRIFAQPHTLTGSIGVFGLFMNIINLANQHGITWEDIKTSKFSSDIGSINKHMDEHELARMQNIVDENYEQFVNCVAANRNMNNGKVHLMAQGRLWSGNNALDIGLIDEIGSLNSAIHCAAKLANIEHQYGLDLAIPSKTVFEHFAYALFGNSNIFVNTGCFSALDFVVDRMKQFIVFCKSDIFFARIPFDFF